MLFRSLFFLMFDLLAWSGVAWFVFCLWQIVRARSPGSRILGTMGIIVVSVTFVLQEVVLKTLIFRRVRPFITFPDASFFTILPGGFSFPSGHTADAFALATFFALVLRKRRLTILFYTVSSIIAFGRVYLGVHYPLDVLAGALVGMAIGALVFEVFRRTRWGRRVLKTI